MKSDHTKTKSRLIQELVSYRKKIAELEGKRIEKELQNDENIYQKIFDQSVVGIGITNHAGETLKTNKAFQNITGYTKSELSSVNIANIYVNPEDRIQLLSLLKKKGVVENFEVELRNKNGNTYWVNASLTNIQYQGQDAILTSMVDITDRKRIEAELRIKHNFNQRMIDASVFFLVVIEIDGKIKFVNKAMLKVLGYSEMEVLGKDYVSIFIPRRERDQLSRLFTEQLLKGIIAHNENHIITKEGKELLVEWYGSPLVDSHGKVETFFGIGVDITKQRELEKSLKSSEEKYFKSFMASPYSMIITRLKDGKIIDVNEGFEKNTGYIKEEAIGKTAAELGLLGDQASNRKKLVEALNKYGKIRDLEFELIGKKGNIINTLVSGEIIDLNGESHVVIIGNNITERKKAEKELAKQQYYLTKAQEIGRIGTWEFDLIKNESNWTDQTYRNMGIPIGTPLTYEIFLDCAHPDDRDYVETEWMAALTGKPYNIEHRVIVDGKVRWVREKAEVEFDKNNKAIKAIGFTQDITERKQAEEEIKKQSAQRQRLLKTGRLLTSSLEIKKVLIHVSEEVRTLLGCKGVTIYMLDDQGKMLKPVLAYDPPYEKQVMAATLDIDNSFTGQTIKTKKGMIINYADQQPDGYHIPGTPVDEDHLIIVPFIIEEKAIGAITIYRRLKQFTDEDLALVETFTMYASQAINNAQVHQELIDQIAERKQAEEEMLKLAAVVKHSSELVNLSSLDGKMIFLNEAGGKMLGIEPHEIENTNIMEVIPDHLIGLVEKELLPALMKGGTWEGDLQYRNKRTGEITDVHAMTFTAKDPNTGKPQFLANVSLDITERKKAELERESALGEARQANKVKDLFLANMSHEIRTPLNSLLGFTEIIEQHFKGRMDEEESEYFQVVHDSGHRLINTVHGILDISRIEAGVLPYNPKVVRLTTPVELIFKEFGPVAAAKNLEFTYDNQIDDGTVKVDEVCIEKAVSNLVDNAIKYTKEGQIKIQLNKKNGKYVLSISDTGIGIGADYLNRIYDAFSQESTGYTKKYQGLGLGLSIAKSCLDINGIPIAVESEQDVGTTFSLTFTPADTIIDEPEIKTGSTDTKVEKTVSKEKPVILLVEDDLNNRKALEIILKDKYETPGAVSVEEAKKQLREHAIDLIILDLSLEGDEDGLDLVAYMKAKTGLKDIPVIAVTAHAFPTDRENVLNAGCDDYMSKPINIKKLLAKIEGLCC